MFSALLKKLRSEKNLTQGQLAKEVGVSPGNVGDWETGKSKPGYNALASLARIFEVSADYLLEIEPSPAKASGGGVFQKENDNMKNDIADILFKYTTGEATLEETNDALKEAEAGFNLEPGRNEITPDEMALTTVGDTPEEANGFGLLDTGTGSMEKVHVTNGKLGEAINQVNHDGTTNRLAFVIIGPNRYEVKGDTLTDC